MAEHLHEFIYLFDIDGTLMKVKDNILRSMLQEVLTELEIDYPDVQTVSLAGRTDYDIFNSFIEGHKDQQTLFEEVKEEYIHRMESSLNHEKIEVFKGVSTCLQMLAEHGASIGLLTGNFKRSGYSKLRAAGIAEYFHFGGFGEQHRSRNELPAVAFEDYFRYSEVKAFPEEFIIIGDTPRDIECAKFSGARSVAVTTGYYSAEDLNEHQPDLLLDELSNPDEWTRAFS